MDSLIVTVLNPEKTFREDMELPRNVPARKLAKDIAETLRNYNEACLDGSYPNGLYCNRLGRRLNPDETLDSAGVWNGDFITLIEVW